MTADTLATPALNKEFLTVQVLRFVAALAVVGVHSTFYTSERLAPGFPVFHQGFHGVRLFFVISGFVMILSSQQLETQAKGWLIFAIRRVLRIVPLYWLILAIKVAVLLGASGLALHSRFDLPVALKSFLFIPALNPDGEIKPLHGVGWTLNFEMFFYLLFTLALLVRIPVVRSLAVVLVLCAALSPLRTADWPVPLQFYCDPMVLDFLAGMLVARWVQRGLALPRALGWGLLAAGLLGLFLPLSVGEHASLGLSVLMTLFSTMTIVGAIALEPAMRTRLPRWALFMGAASYSLYLVHPMLAPAAPVVMMKLHMAWPLLAVFGSMVIALTGGALLYLLVERPVSRFLTGLLKASRLMRPPANSVRA